MVLTKVTLLLPLVGACTHPLSTLQAVSPSDGYATEPTTEAVRPASATVRWSVDTRSPNPTLVSPELRALAVECGEVDARLSGAADWLATLGEVGRFDDEGERLKFALRAFGVPYLSPRAWTRAAATRAAAETEEEIRALRRWLDTSGEDPPRRCGLARVNRAEGQFTLVLVSKAPADLLKPLPTRARVGQWLELVAELKVEASRAKVVLLGPGLDPWTVPTEQSGALVRARFPAASPGRWEIQLIAEADRGPQQVLEAVVFVDVVPSITYRPGSAPGEIARRALDDSPELAIASMLAGLRAQTGRPALMRDSRLDRLAAIHAQSMLRARSLGHDVGAGSTRERLTAVDLEPRLAGENVAHAADPLRVHRALWASPSHRLNLLDRRFTRWGLGVAIDADGSLWVCELFASEL